MKGLGRLLSEALFPRTFTCDICGIETFGTELCNDCLKTITFNDGVTCPVCGRETIRPEICLECKAQAPLYSKAVSPLVYDGGVITLIHKFKNGNGYLQNYFADLIVEKLAQLPKADCIVYVPMTKKAERARSYNQAELLADTISEKTGLPVIKGAVTKIKDTAEQKSLSFKDRAENLKTCFKVEKKSEIKGKKILLIDDILTTGATADCVCRKLLNAGAEKVFFATVASVAYKPKTAQK